MQKQPLTKPLQVQKIPPQPVWPGAPLVEPSMLAFNQPWRGVFRDTKMILGQGGGIYLEFLSYKESEDRLVNFS